MLKLIIVAGIIFVLAIVMTMAGRGGGNFYVLTLVLAGVPMHQAATTGQFILFMTAFAALIIFQKHKVVSWPLALFIGPLTALAALGGGYLSHWFTGFTLKLIFSAMLALAGMLMLFPVRERTDQPAVKTSLGHWRLKSAGETYLVNLWVAVPIIVLSGFGSGMVGVSGGSFLVPLMVLACQVPMRTAVGTASSLIGATALMGFLGHAAQGDFNPKWAIPLAAVTIIGGILGGKFALKTKPKSLKMLFAYTTLLAALFMLVNAFYNR
ncbi:MAG: sulfite exporter TauE/SafE family protein [Deltaproteobacteria bacterium]|nr:sulfite exporter TauE/SafE family protein [Deltaproteobacteria bacterium]MBW2069857.1 sulfite exporter TauE/SafE family protein [Deltaproteobacteria bacterium]